MDKHICELAVLVDEVDAFVQLLQNIIVFLVVSLDAEMERDGQTVVVGG